MIRSFALLFGCLAAGEILSGWTGLPVPGAITGMGLLLAGLAVSGGSAPLTTIARGLLAHLSLLLVPGGAGIIAHAGRIREEWISIAAALLTSTVLTVAVTAITFRAVARLLGQDPDTEAVR